MKKYNLFIFAILLFLLLTYSSYAGNFTWDGSSSTAWTDSSNWTTTGTPGVPSTNDTVTIVTNTNQPLLAANTTIKKFTITSGTLDCNSYTLMISATATFNGGTINNGTITCSGTSTLTFAGTIFGAAVNATGNNILFSGSVFNSTLTAVKKGTSSDNGNGGNVFNDVVTITDSSSGNLVLSNNSSSPDTFNAELTVASRGSGSIYLAHQGTNNVFNGKVTMYSSSSGRIYSNYYGTAYYNDSIVVNSTSSGGEYFGMSTGSCTVANYKTISIGSEGFDHTASGGTFGTLYFHNFNQSNATAINLTLTGSRATLKFEPGCVFYGNITVSAPGIFFDGCRFLGKVSATYTTGSGYTLGSVGGNYFGDSVTVIQGNAANVSMGVTAVDTFATYAHLQNTATGFSINNALFLGDVKFKNALTNNQTEHYWVASTGSVTIKGTATIENANSTTLFGSSGGNTVLDTNSTLSITSGSGKVQLWNVVKYGTNSTSISMSGSGDLLYLNTGNIFNGEFDFSGQRIFLNGTIFNGSVNILRTSATTDACYGGNVFNGTTTVICDSVSTTNSNRSFQLATVNPDDFNGNVTFKQYGSGTGGSTVRLYPAYTKNSTFAGNVTVDGSSAIEFGANGGKVILDGGKGQTLSKTGSYVPSFKRIEINSHEGEVILSYPLSLADTLFLVDGIVTTDATNILSVPDGKIISGGSDSSYINGPLKKVGNDAFTFPLGDESLSSGAYHPLEISAPSTTGATYTAQYFAQGQTFGSSKVDSIGYLSTCEYWSLDRNADTCQVTPTLWWNTNSCNIDTSLQRVAYWNSSQWVSLGKGTVTGTTSKGSVSSAQKVDLFGKFTLAQVCNLTADISSSHSGTICVGVTDTITATPSGFTSYQFFKNGTSIQTGSSDKYISSSLANGDVIKVKATNVGGCFSYDSLTMVVNGLPSVSITTDSTTFCKGQTHTLTASGTSLTNYLWSPGGATTSSRTANTAGTYSVTVSNGTCSNSATQVIALYDTIQPTITVIGRTTICTGTTSELYGELTDAVNYLWSTLETTQLITVEDSAIYQITCLNAHGCYVHNWQAMEQANNPTAPIIFPTGIVNLCTSDSGITNSSVTLHTTNYSTNLTWSSSEITQDIVVDYEDNFNLTYTDPTSGCSSVSNTATTIISSYSVLPSSITTNKTGNEICKGDSITLIENTGVLGAPIYYGDSTGPTYWAWYIGACGDSLVGTGSSITVHPIEDTKYYLRVEGPCGTVCDSVMVFCMNISVTATNISCLGYENGTSRVYATGGSKPYVYNWSPRVGGSVAIWGLSAGYYSVTVTDSIGCSLTDSTLVNNPDSMHVAIATTTSECHDSIGTAKILATGGSENYTYFWIPDGLTKDSIGGLKAGVYAVTVTDHKGCSIDTLVIISDSDGPVTSVEVTSNVGCNGYNDGSIFLNLCTGCIPNDPLPLCTHVIGNNNRLAAGIYPIEVTDTNGCMTIVTATITQPPAIELEISTTQSLCQDSSGSATVSVIGGSGGYLFQWSTGGNDSVEANLPSGFDTVTVTDANGCVSMSVALVTDSNGPILTTSSTNLMCFDSNSGEVTVSASGGIYPYEYNWFEIGKTDSSVDSLYQGTFNVLVTDSNGCKQKAAADIESSVVFEVDVISSAPTTDSTSDGTASAYVQGGTPPYEYLWLPDSQATAFISGMGSQDLSLKVTDNNGCVLYKVLSIPPGPLIPCATQNLHFGYQRDELPNCNVLINPCNSPPCTTLSIVDFGADPSGTSSSECAFEAANAYINSLYNTGMNPGDVFTLQFPAGTYLVGRQTYWGETRYLPGLNITAPQVYWFAKGHDIFRLESINNNGQNNPIVFEGLPGQNGSIPKIKFVPCLRYGSFVPIDNNDPNSGERFLPALNTNATSCYVANIGTLFNFICSKNITIKNLELDGNIQNLAIGGGTHAGTGINADHSGILVEGDGSTCGSSEITIEGVDVHDFGYAGIQVPSQNMTGRVNLVLRNSKFNNNGCCGFAWEGCTGVRAENCQFNRNALDVITTMEASGIDIETLQNSQGTVTPVSDGIFVDCEFKFNSRSGVQSEYKPGQGGFTFTRCSFIGSEMRPWIRPKEGPSIYIAVPRVHFNCCDFYGEINTAWSSLNDADKMVFNLCAFNEEYTDPVDNKTWSLTEDCASDCTNPTGDVGHRGFLFDLGANYMGRVTFNQCRFNTNYRAGLINFYSINFPNRIKMMNCDFLNSGLNNASQTDYCSYFSNLTNSYLINAYQVDFIGRNTLNYNREYGCNSTTGSRNNPSIDYKWSLDHCWKNSINPNNPTINLNQEIYNTYYYLGICSTKVCNILNVPCQFDLQHHDVAIGSNLDYLPCQKRFENPNTLKMFSVSWFFDEYDAFPSACIPDNQKSINPFQHANNFDAIEVSPNPVIDELVIYNILSGEFVFLYDIVGNLVLQKRAIGSSLQLNLNGLPSGIYFLNVINKKSLKIVKIR